MNIDVVDTPLAHTCEIQDAFVKNCVANEISNSSIASMIPQKEFSKVDEKIVEDSKFDLEQLPFDCHYISLDGKHTFPVIFHDSVEGGAKEKLLKVLKENMLVKGGEPLILKVDKHGLDLNDKKGEKGDEPVLGTQDMWEPWNPGENVFEPKLELKGKQVQNVFKKKKTLVSNFKTP